MKVKIGDKVYDAEEEPILLILTEDDKNNIKNMDPEASKFCIFPDHMNDSYIRAFMKMK